MTPHARHLAEMRATREPVPTVDALDLVPCRALTADEIARGRVLAAAMDRDRHLRLAYPDPTQRHLAEMRLMAKERP